MWAVCVYERIWHSPNEISEDHCLYLVSEMCVETTINLAGGLQEVAEC